jgi:hypothetical protein
VRVRTIELRILGLVLGVLWVAAFVLVVAGYRPGGPVDGLVGLAAAGPALVAFIAVRFPPVARGDRAFAGIAWLGLGAVLLLLPSLAGLVAQLTGRGPQTLLPSLEAAYPWLLALAATCVYAGIGVARRRLGETVVRRRRFLAGGTLGMLLLLVTGSAFSAAAIVNELAVSNRLVVGSRFGPTEDTAEPPDCTDPVVAGATARLQLRMDGSIDGRYAGQLVIDGIRNGADMSWTGFAATREELGTFGATRIGDQAWRLEPGEGWHRVARADVAGSDLDRQLVAVALTPSEQNAPEDRGLAYIEGALARHCRITLVGSTLRRALPEVRLILGDADVDRWRGELDFWVFADGQLGQADGRITGSAVGLAEDALQAGLRFRLLAYDRGLPVAVLPPVR